MFTNILHLKKTKIIHKPIVFSDLHVECIVYELSDFDEVLKQIRSECQKLNIIFMTRKFNSNKYSNDRNYITQLPALHIHVNEQYRNTIFPKHDPINIIKIIKMELSIYNDKLKEKIRKKEERKIYYDELYVWVTSFFRSKTALEKTKEKASEIKLKQKKFNDEPINVELSPINKQKN
jgi:hypothetical protein